MYKFEQVAESIREKIRSGEWPKGHRLPSTKDLLEQYKVGYGTLHVAMRELKMEGLIEGQHGVGVFVK